MRQRSQLQASSGAHIISNCKSVIRVKQSVVDWFSAHYCYELNDYQIDVVNESLLFI